MHSLKKGGEIISHIAENLNDKYKIVDILIDKDYIWHMNGLPVNPGDLVTKIDLAWNVSHPSFSRILESLAIPHIGSNSFIPTMEGNLPDSRQMLRRHLKSINLSMPRTILLPVYQKDFDGEEDKYALKKAKEVFEKFGAPWIVKSFTPDKNMAIHLAKTFPELVEAIYDGVRHKNSILIEEFFAGKIASVHSVKKFRGTDVYIFPVGSRDGAFGDFSPSEKEKLYSLAKILHEHLDAKHYLKSNFIVNKRGKVYLLDVELVPDLKPDSHFSQICLSVGAKPHHVVEHILESAS